jgi:hypothetical protein
VWRINSRSLWLQAGDKNTSFFHRQAKSRQWINKITKIKTQSGETITDFEQIKQQATNKFTKLYSSEGNIDKDLSNLFLSHTLLMISRMDNIKLNMPI